MNNRRSTQSEYNDRSYPRLQKFDMRIGNIYIYCIAECNLSLFRLKKIGRVQIAASMKRLLVIHVRSILRNVVMRRGLFYMTA